MPSADVSEKIYFEDEQAKVTNIRITCNHITVPVDKLSSVEVNFRSESFFIALFLLLLSFSPLLFVTVIPESIKLPVAAIVFLLIAGSALWAYFVYRTYVQLVVYVRGQRMILKTASMYDRQGITKLAEAIGQALLEEQKYQEAKASGETQSPDYDPSQTAMLKFMLDDYERLKKMHAETLGGKKEEDSK